MSYREQRRFKEAKEDIEEGLKLDPGNDSLKAELEKIKEDSVTYAGSSYIHQDKEYPTNWEVYEGYSSDEEYTVGPVDYLAQVKADECLRDPNDIPAKELAKTLVSFRRKAVSQMRVQQREEKRKEKRKEQRKKSGLYSK